MEHGAAVQLSWMFALLVELVYGDDMDTATTSIEERVAELSGVLNVVHGQLVAVVADVADSGVWATYGGVRSLPQWICWQFGVAPHTAHDLIRVAAARPTHPLLSGQLADGEITLDQAAAAVKVRPECDVVMSHLAPLSTVTQIRTEVRAANGPSRRPAPPVEPDASDPDPVEPALPDEVVAYGLSDDGGQWWMSAGLDVDRGKVVQAALEEAPRSSVPRRSPRRQLG